MGQFLLILGGVGGDTGGGAREGCLRLCSPHAPSSRHRLEACDRVGQ